MFSQSLCFCPAKSLSQKYWPATLSYLTNRDLAWHDLFDCVVTGYRKKYLPTVRRIPDEVWNEVRRILPSEKPSNTKGRPPVSYRKVLDGILYVLRTGCQWKMLSKDYGSGSTCHRRFQQWVRLGVFQRLWVRLLQVYDGVKGIKWNWQSLDSISVKAPLGGNWLDLILLTAAS